LAHLNRWH